ncbi:MAG: dephospho-CoA kinase [Acidobacteriota bacterium]
MLLVGLTGGVASGKSAVVRLLAARGAAVCDADQVVHELYLPAGAGTRAVRELFGEAMLAANGGVDTAVLAARALANQASRERLEAAIHPLVRREIGSWLESLSAGDPARAVAVVEAALLVETGSFRAYHRLVVVSAPEHERRRRALAAGWSSERFERLLAAQLSDPEREAVADYVIRNDGDLLTLAAAVNELWRPLQEDAALLAAGLPLPARR